MIESGLVSLLRSNAELVSMIGNQIYPVILPANATYPCLSYHTMSKPPTVAMDKTANEAARIQIDCWATSYSGVKTLQQMLHAQLDGFSGECPNNVDVIQCSRDVEADYWESDSKVFRCLSEYTIVYPSGQ